jgi:hypothetical protein
VQAHYAYGMDCSAIHSCDHCHARFCDKPEPVRPWQFYTIVFVDAQQQRKQVPWFPWLRGTGPTSKTFMHTLHWKTLQIVSQLGCTMCIHYGVFRKKGTAPFAIPV